MKKRAGSHERAYKMITDAVLANELKAAVLEAARGSTFPIDLDDMATWLFYKLRQRLVTILTTKFSRDVDYIEQEPTPDDNDHKKYFVTVDCFEKFCKFRKGAIGRKVHTMFVEVREAVSIADTPAQIDSTESIDTPESDSESESSEREDVLSADNNTDSKHVIATTQDSNTVRITTCNNVVVTDSNSGEITTTSSHDTNNTNNGAGDIYIYIREADKHHALHAESTQRIGSNNTIDISQDALPHHEQITPDHHVPPHKRTFSEIEETWAQQNAKMQKLLDTIDSPYALDPPNYIFTPLVPDTSITATDSSVPSCDHEDQTCMYDDIAYLLNL
jgi:hypothetical protein